MQKERNVAERNNEYPVWPEQEGERDDKRNPYSPVIYPGGLSYTI